VPSGGAPPARIDQGARPAASAIVRLARTCSGYSVKSTSGAEGNQCGAGRHPDRGDDPERRGGPRPGSIPGG
jgi:hypothetical protein